MARVMFCQVNAHYQLLLSSGKNDTFEDRGSS